jgi:tetratricopeptide (TPR) repeat protein
MGILDALSRLFLFLLAALAAAHPMLVPLGVPKWAMEKSRVAAPAAGAHLDRVAVTPTLADDATRERTRSVRSSLDEYLKEAGLRSADDAIDAALEKARPPSDRYAYPDTVRRIGRKAKAGWVVESSLKKKTDDVWLLEYRLTKTATGESASFSQGVARQGEEFRGNDIRTAAAAILPKLGDVLRNGFAARAPLPRKVPVIPVKGPAGTTEPTGETGQPLPERPEPPPEPEKLPAPAPSEPKPGPLPAPAPSEPKPGPLPAPSGLKLVELTIKVTDANNYSKTVSGATVELEPLDYMDANAKALSDKAMRANPKTTSSSGLIALNAVPGKYRLTIGRNMSDYENYVGEGVFIPSFNSRKEVWLTPVRVAAPPPRDVIITVVAPDPSGAVRPILAAAADANNRVNAQRMAKDYAGAVASLDSAIWDADRVLSMAAATGDDRAQAQRIKDGAFAVVADALYEAGKTDPDKYWRRAEPILKALFDGMPSGDKSSRRSNLAKMLRDISKWRYGDTSAATARYRSVIEEIEPTADGAFSKASPLIDAERYREAIPHLERAIRLDRDYYKGYFWLGYCQYHTEMHVAAKRNLEHYLQCAPNGENAGTARTYLGLIK